MFKKMVICDHKDDSCPKECPHRMPHGPIDDMWEYEETGYCNEMFGMCGYRTDMPICQCIPVDQ